MPSPGMLRRVAVVRTDVLEEVITIIRVTRMIMEVLTSSETPVFTRATQCNIPQDGILYSHRLENLKSYIALTG
jgi:hypothetical protein